MSGTVVTVWSGLITESGYQWRAYPERIVAVTRRRSYEAFTDVMRAFGAASSAPAADLSSAAATLSGGVASAQPADTTAGLRPRPMTMPTAASAAR
ncbi:MAG: hypothetical protein JWR37_984 [Mycobacterium sp.]|jgi:hypothetical protein|nr:hypothetical protein [Mycobacterium sp.]